MRISSSMIYDLGIKSINDQMTTLLHNEQMLSTGRRVVTPADDPVAAARALVVTEAKDINTQFGTNQGNAKDALNLEESQMSSLGDLLTRVRQLAVQGGDGALSSNDLKSISAELRSRFEELMGIANTTDSNGDFIFSGNMGGTKPFGGNVDALLAAPGNEVTYSGDSGQRNLQVSATRFLQVSDAGNGVFRQIANGNGSFVTDYNTTNSGTAVIDAGSVLNSATWDALPNKNYSINFWVDSNGIVGTPGTTYYDLVDTTTGNSLLTGNPPVVPGSTSLGPPPVPNLSAAGLRSYHDANAIPLSKQPGDPGPAFDLGASVTVTGQPATGDSFSIAPSTTQSVFKTIANLIGALEGQSYSTLSMPYNAGTANGGGTFDLTVNGASKQITIPAAAYTPVTLATAMNTAIVSAFGTSVATASVVNGNIVLSAPSNGSTSAGIALNTGGTVVTTPVPATPLNPAVVFGAMATGTVTQSSTALANKISQALTNIDQSYDNVLRVRAGIGARLNEIDSLSSVNQDVDVRYQQTLSNLQDVDFAKTISDLQQNQTNLDAAQKSYMKVTQLGLFNYL